MSLPFNCFIGVCISTLNRTSPGAFDFGTMAKFETQGVFRPPFYTPDIRSKWGIQFSLFRSSVRSFVRTYVRSFVCSFVFPSQGQSFCVKVYKTSYFEDPLMDFIHIWHGRYRSKVFISTIPTPGVTLGSRSRTSNFHKKSQGQIFCVKVYDLIF